MKLLDKYCPISPIVSSVPSVPLSQSMGLCDFETVGTGLSGSITNEHFINLYERKTV